jgi:transposase
MCQNEVVEDLKRGRPSVTKIIRIGMDTSKSVFVLHGVDAAEQPVLRKKLRRRQVLDSRVRGNERARAGHDTTE